MFIGGALWCQAMSGLPLARGISCWPIKADDCGSSLSWEGIYRDARCLGGGHCCYNMADLIKEVKEEGSEIEIVSIWSKKSQGLKEGRERVLIRPRIWTVRRSNYLTHVFPLHPLPETYSALAWHKPLVNAHPFSHGSPSQPPSLMSFWMTVFLTDTKDYEAGKINTSAESWQD